jgi:hypothetical protein
MHGAGFRNFILFAAILDASGWEITRGNAGSAQHRCRAAPFTLDNRCTDVCHTGVHLRQSDVCTRVQAANSIIAYIILQYVVAFIVLIIRWEPSRKLLWYAGALKPSLDVLTVALHR